MKTSIYTGFPSWPYLIRMVNMFLRGTALPKSVSCECFLADVRKDERPETSRLLKWCLPQALKPMDFCKKKDVPGFPVPRFNQVWKSKNSTPEHRIWYPFLHQSCFFLCASTGLQTVSDSASMQLSIRNHDLYLGHHLSK